MRQVSLFLFLIFFNTYFSKEKEILSIDNAQVLKSEFEQIYGKNKKEKKTTKEDLELYPHEPDLVVDSIDELVR